MDDERRLFHGMHQIDCLADSCGEPGLISMKTVMVYRMDRKTMSKEPLGILVERRKKERGDNITGMVRLARKEFVGTENGSNGIVVGDYVIADPVTEYPTEYSPHPESHFKRQGKE